LALLLDCHNTPAHTLSCTHLHHISTHSWTLAHKRSWTLTGGASTSYMPLVMRNAHRRVLEGWLRQLDSMYYVCVLHTPSGDRWFPVESGSLWSQAAPCCARQPVESGSLWTQGAPYHARQPVESGSSLSCLSHLPLLLCTLLLPISSLPILPSPPPTPPLPLSHQCKLELEMEVVTEKEEQLHPAGKFPI